MPDLSIIIPAYNEEKRIGKTLEEYSKFLKNKISFEILVILNGCKDNTLSVVKKLSKKYKQIRFMEFKEAIGKGGAIIEGFKKANSRLIGFVDADNATKPPSFYELVENISGYDGIIASRWVKGARVSVKQPLMRRIASRAFNVLVRILFGIKIKDTQCGAKLFKKEAVKTVVNKLGITRWAFDIDLLYLMKRNDFRIGEIPTEWFEPGETHLKLFRTTIEMYLSVIRLRLIYSPFKFIVRIYDFFA